MNAPPPTDVPACIEAGAGPDTVLFLHGIGGDSGSFADNLPALPEGWRGLAWDAPGYGDSAPLDEMTFETLATAAIRLLDAQRVRRAVIVGHSMGGMIAQEIAARHPERVRGLVLFATSASFGGRDALFRMKFLADRLAPLDRGMTPGDIARPLVPSLFGPEPPPGALERAVASMAALSSATYRQALNCIVHFDRKDDLARIACPTLALAAEHDMLAPPRTMERMAQAVPGARYRCLAGAGHLANMEDPAAFNAEIGGFLQDIPRQDPDRT
ncbi:MAG: alpha/beta fold hydrolase [Rhodospirillaceae bacterium]|nr:alpha/beta fold hydrolase [Rhodospirillaceae bacterium]MYF86387.1 alpha/beta fold hydrolase [Rhodospirillaceae bacterium]MYH38632.1 alpha/beta fold hydrolase [Rhodospirillaceae bacterium]MYK13924.1 alpha/beta fold hydrolase [Rhodospirillaceae bacterium]MYK59448.1 alpha/beta fold hydrolase [Rhodospirillaceae bacterium]